MYLSREAIAEIEHRFGKPEYRETRFEMGQIEFDGLRRSQKHGRSHDITLFIRKGEKFIVNAKHFYPENLYRPPSGGLEPGEDFVGGALREAKEETGCDVRLDKYILRINVEFHNNSDSVLWTSHVFLAEYLSGELRQIDSKEIREVSLASISDFPRFREMMLETDRGGFHYRAFLHDEVLSLLNGDNPKI